MYCSFRFYIDNAPLEPTPGQILQVFDLFVDELGISFDFISYVLLSPNTDQMLISKNYAFDSNGREEFILSEKIKCKCETDGVVTAPFLEACSYCNESELYSKARVQIQFPEGMQPMIIRVDYSQRYAETMTFRKYKNMIARLCNNDFHVNNSLFHVYVCKNEAVTLDGGQINSFLGLYGRRNIKKSVSHRKKHCLNHLLGIFCANSMPSALMSLNTRNAISNIVGSHNIAVINDSTLFILPDIERITGDYRFKYRLTISKLQKALDSTIYN